MDPRIGRARSQSAGSKSEGEARLSNELRRPQSESREGIGVAGAYVGEGQEQHTKIYDRYITSSDVLNPEPEEQASYNRVSRLIDNVSTYDLVEKFKFIPHDFVKEPEPDGTFDYLSDSFLDAQADLGNFVKKLTDPESSVSELRPMFDTICGNETTLSLLLFLYKDNEEDFHDIFLNMPQDMVSQLVAAFETKVVDANEYPLLEYLQETYPAAHENLIQQQIEFRKETVLANLSGVVENMSVADFTQLSGMMLKDEKQFGWLFKRTTSETFDAAKQQVQDFLTLIKDNELNDFAVTNAWMKICKNTTALMIIKSLYVNDATENDLLSFISELPLSFVEDLRIAYETHRNDFKSEAIREELVEIKKKIRGEESVPVETKAAEITLPREEAASREDGASHAQTTQSTKAAVTAAGASSASSATAVPGPQALPVLGAHRGRQTRVEPQVQSPLPLSAAALEAMPAAGSAIPRPVPDNTERLEEPESLERQYFFFNESRLTAIIDGLEIDDTQQGDLKAFIFGLAKMRDAIISIDAGGNLIFKIDEKEVAEVDYLVKIQGEMDTKKLATLLKDIYFENNSALIDLLSSLPNSVKVAVLSRVMANIEEKEDQDSLQRNVAAVLGDTFGATPEDRAVEAARIGRMLVRDQATVDALIQAATQVSGERKAALDLVPEMDESAKAVLQTFNVTHGSPDDEDTMDRWVAPIRSELAARAEAQEAIDEGEDVQLPDTPVCDAIVALNEMRHELEEGTITRTGLEEYMEGLPASYWVPLAGIEKLHGAVVEKLKNSDPEDWVIALDRDSAIKLTRDLAPEVLKSIHEANRPNIAVRFFRAVLSWVTWSGATNYADIQQARFIAGVVEEFSAEADLQALCHEGNLAKLIESLTIENFDSFFRNTDVFTQPALTVLAQHSPRVSEALRKYIAGQEDPDAYIKENLDRLSPDLAMTFFQHIDFSEETKENSAEYVKLLLENVNASDNPKDVQALVDIKKFVTQFEDAIQDPSYRDGVLQNTQPGILFAIAGEASGLRKVLVEGMLPVLRQNLNTPHQLAGDAAEAEQDVFKYIFNNLDAADFFALAKLDSQCSLLILGKDAQKRGFFGKVVDVAASVFSFLQGGEDEVENANLSPDGILERLFNQNVQSQSEGDMHETLDAAISAYLRQEIPLNVLQHYFRLVIQDDNYKLDQFISKFGRGIFEDLTEALSDPEVAETYDYDPQDSRAMDALRADLRDKLVQNFKLFQDLIKVSTAQKIQLMLAGELDVDIPTREEGIASAYNKLNPSQMLGIMRSFLMAPEDNRWFRTWRSPLPISEQSQMHAGYLAEYLQSYLDAGISVGGESRLQHMQNTNSELADEMAFILDQLNEVKAGTYDRIRGPQAVRDHTAINTLSFDPDVDAQAIDDAKHFEGETTWNLTRRRILNNWHAQITSSSGSQMTPWAFNKIIKSMLDVLEEVTEEEGEYSLQGEVYQTRYITPPDVVKLIGQVIDDAASANLITPKAYGLLMKYIQEGRSSGAPGVKELGQALGGQLAIGNPNIGSSIYDAFNLEAPVDV